MKTNAPKTYCGTCSGVVQTKKFHYSKSGWDACEKRAKFSTKYCSHYSFSCSSDCFQNFSCSTTTLIAESSNSACSLVNLLASNFSCFNDVASFENRKSIRLLKRAQSKLLFLPAQIFATQD